MAQAARFLVIILCVNVVTVTANEMGNRESDYYNWMDEIAQAACTGVMTVDGTVYAVRRYCVASGQPICSTVCTNQGLTCFEALHVYPNQPRLSETHGEAVGEVGPWVHRYGSCGSTHCGPNYCCCRG
ncbi:uncharacterized protein LOC106154730 [Lingula anatina]|uniref:Uncharacterized protein LOC106154730 n=1 Tax=Lingula anatina TaxID=7574 RepID=A0A1S3HF32_LINAN|nr:uncharacterized protein LOC106154730 [Lingula anatina]|eukprot:XP_013384640.1 uncharacterized protein LOC106154730 [Lingula anatina]